MKAVIMAGGMGTRLRPVTGDKPKPMADLLGRPIMEHIVLHLKDCGFDDICAALKYRAGDIMAHFGDGSRFGVRMQYRLEEDALGTRRLMEAELLILDDLGTEPSTKTSSSAIYRLINQRVLVNGLPTIISTNLTYRQLEKEYDSAVLSRLLGEFNVKLFRGEDIRMAKLRR